MLILIKYTIENWQQKMLKISFINIWNQLIIVLPLLVLWTVEDRTHGSYFYRQWHIVHHLDSKLSKISADKKKLIKIYKAIIMYCLQQWNKHQALSKCHMYYKNSKKILFYEQFFDNFPSHLYLKPWFYASNRRLDTMFNPYRLLVFSVWFIVNFSAIIAFRTPGVRSHFDLTDVQVGFRTIF